MSQAQINTNPPDRPLQGRGITVVRCGMCGGRCKPDPLLGPRWINCPSCPWSSHSPRRVGWVWRLRVWMGR